MSNSLLSTIHPTRAKAVAALKAARDPWDQDRWLMEIQPTLGGFSISFIPNATDRAVQVKAEAKSQKYLHLKNAKKAAVKTRPIVVHGAKKKGTSEKAAKMAADAASGKLPKAPDFSAPSRARYRTKLAGITKLVKARDVKGLKALSINPVDSANKIMLRYRDHALVALQAQG